MNESGLNKFYLGFVFILINFTIQGFDFYQNPIQVDGIYLGVVGILSILIAIVALVLKLLVVYNLFMFIKDMARELNQLDLVIESNVRWNQFMMLQIATLFSLILILIPTIAVVYGIVLLIISIIITIVVLGYLKRCDENLSSSLRFLMR